MKPRIRQLLTEWKKDFESFNQFEGPIITDRYEYVLESLGDKPEEGMKKLGINLEASFLREIGYVPPKKTLVFHPDPLMQEIHREQLEVLHAIKDDDWR